MEYTIPVHCIPERYHVILVTKLHYCTNTAY